MSLVPKEILLSHLQRAEGAEEVTLPIDFFRDLLYQAMPRTWVGLDPEKVRKTKHHMVDGAYHYSFKQGAEWAEAELKEKNT